MSRWLRAAGVSTEVQKGHMGQKGQKAPIGIENPASVPSVPFVPFVLTSKDLTPVHLDAFEERAAIIEHDTFLPRREAETLAAQEQDFDDADSLHRESVGRWAVEIERLANLPTVSPDGAEALKRVQAFISGGWALQAVRLGWDEVDLFGVCPRTSWRHLGRAGAAFGDTVKAVTQDAVIYVGGLRRYRATVNNYSGVVLIWELVQNNPSSGGNATLQI